ncbi:hypothetical protein [Paraburkholderia sp. ZP32-5]|nr:hypothetical protein [Paraburkholderia sp. ZP32-5]
MMQMKHVLKKSAKKSVIGADLARVARDALQGEMEKGEKNDDVQRQR